MIKKIKFNRYRKLVNLNIDFSKNLNIISGTNGTCKSTLMHLISNSFQAVKRTDERLGSTDALNLLNKFNDKVNPKIESVSRGDRNTYNNPAEGVSGTLFSVDYFGDMTLEFRKHNSRNETHQENYRFAIKPQYKHGSKETLPALPVVYLGLSRLFPYNELSDGHPVSDPKGQLPEYLHNEFVEQFHKLTNIEIKTALHQDVSGVKKRNDFTTNKDGIDSNTISSGEDNISIILTALNCLRYYYDCLHDDVDIASVLLIDEFDASLHPSIQVDLLNLIVQYSLDYKIQVFFTTHSLYLLKHAYESKHKIIYLVDQIDEVDLMDDPSPAHIEMHLSAKLHTDMYKNVYIPVYTEDAEARIFLKELLDYISKTSDPNFAMARVYLHFVDANIGANSLKNLFSDKHLNHSSIRSICILDGDQECKIHDHIISLPGSDNPEKLLGMYASKLFSDSKYRSFWQENFQYGYSKPVAQKIINEFCEIDKGISALKDAGESTKGVRRTKSKDHFVKHQDFYMKVLSHWLANPDNQKVIQKFSRDLRSVFLKTAPYHGIGKEVWRLNDSDASE